MISFRPQTRYCEICREPVKTMAPNLRWCEKCRAKGYAKAQKRSNKRHYEDKRMERILREQREARDLVISGHPDQRGAKQGVADWVMEEVLMRKERTR